MKKLDPKGDNGVDSKKLIESIQKRLPNEDVNIYNVNKFYAVLEDRAICKNCKGLGFCKMETKGYYNDYSDDEFYLQECKYKKEARLQDETNSLIKTLYMPKKVLNASIDTFDLNSESRKTIYKQMTDFINKYGIEKCKGLYLYGSFSIGKTYALACIANELAKNNINSLLIYFPDLVLDIKNSLEDSNRFQELINMLKSVDVLMLDDIGAENMTPWVRDEILGPVINYRVLEDKPVFISANISPIELIAHLAVDKQQASLLKAKRIISRLEALVDIVDMDDCKKYER